MYAIPANHIHPCQIKIVFDSEDKRIQTDLSNLQQKYLQKFYFFHANANPYQNK